MQEQFDEAETPMGQWARGPVTVMVRERIEKLIASAIHELHAACEQTTDGRVADAYGKMKGAQAALLMFKPEKRS